MPEELYERYNRSGNAAKRRRDQSTLDKTLYLTSASEQAALDELFAEAIYSSGVAFNFVSILYTRTPTTLTDL